MCKGGVVFGRQPLFGIVFLPEIIYNGWYIGTCGTQTGGEGANTLLVGFMDGKVKSRAHQSAIHERFYE